MNLTPQLSPTPSATLIMHRLHQQIHQARPFRLGIYSFPTCSKAPVTCLLLATTFVKHLCKSVEQGQILKFANTKVMNTLFRKSFMGKDFSRSQTYKAKLKHNAQMRET